MSVNDTNEVLHLTRLGCLYSCGSQSDLKSAPGGIRTHDRRIRNPLLYPTELRVQSLRG